MVSIILTVIPSINTRQELMFQERMSRLIPTEIEF